MSAIDEVIRNNAVAITNGVKAIATHYNLDEPEVYNIFLKAFLTNKEHGENHTN